MRNPYLLKTLEIVKSFRMAPSSSSSSLEENASLGESTSERSDSEEERKRRRQLVSRRHKSAIQEKPRDQYKYAYVTPS